MLKRDDGDFDNYNKEKKKTTCTVGYEHPMWPCNWSLKTGHYGCKPCNRDMRTVQVIPIVWIIGTCDHELGEVTGKVGQAN